MDVAYKFIMRLKEIIKGEGGVQEQVWEVMGQIGVNIAKNDFLNIQKVKLDIIVEMVSFNKEQAIS